MNKRYEYEDEIYCEDNLSEEIDNYGGDLFDLFLSLNRDNKTYMRTIFCVRKSSKSYETTKELIESEFSDLEVKENE